MRFFGLPEFVLILAIACTAGISAILWNNVDVGQVCNINTFEKEGELGICKSCIERLGPTCKECDEEKYCKKCIDDRYT